MSSGMVVRINGMSNTGKTTLADTIVQNSGFVKLKEVNEILDEENIKLVYSDEESQEIRNQAILYEYELKRLVLLGEHLRSGENVVMDRDFVSTYAISYVLATLRGYRRALINCTELYRDYISSFNLQSQQGEVRDIVLLSDYYKIIERNNLRKNKLSESWLEQRKIALEREFFLRERGEGIVIDTTCLTPGEVYKKTRL